MDSAERKVENRRWDRKESERWRGELFCIYRVSSDTAMKERSIEREKKKKKKREKASKGSGYLVGL